MTSIMQSSFDYEISLSEAKEDVFVHNSISEGGQLEENRWQTHQN